MGEPRWCPHCPTNDYHDPENCSHRSAPVLDEKGIEAMRQKAEELGYRPGEFWDDHLALVAAYLSAVEGGARPRPG